MSALWLLPAVITLVGLIPIIIAAREASEEAEQTMREIGRFRGLRPALVELRSEAEATREAWQHLGRR